MESGLKFKSILDAVVFYAKTTPDKIAIADKDKKLTYRETVSAVKKVGEYLKKINENNDDYFVIECSQKVNYMILILAVKSIGKVYVPIEENANENRINDIMCELKKSIFISKKQSDNDIDKLIVSSKTEIVDIDSVDFIYKDGTSLSEILFTTGTTGKAKGIMYSEDNNRYMCENSIISYEISSDTTDIVPLPLNHSMSLRETYCCLFAGATLVISENIMNVKQFIDLVREYKVNFMCMNEGSLKLIMALSKNELARPEYDIKGIVFGSQKISEEFKDYLIKTFPNTRLFNNYGLTECGRTAYLEFSKYKNLKNCIGLPTKNSKFKIVDKDFNEIKDSNENNLGYISMSGGMIMLGYLNDEERTKSIIKDGYIISQDLGYIGKDGFIYIIGRDSDIINYKGIKIIPEDIEGIANKYDSVLDSALVGVPDNLYHEFPRLFIKVSDKNVFNMDEFKNYLRTNISSDMMPKEICVIDDIPHAYNGKLLRKKLKEMNK